MNSLTVNQWRVACGITLAIALLATLPTTGDLGLTWDEPAYRYSQQFSGQWWERLANARSFSEVQNLFDADTLLYYWPYARFGINFHPPLAGQLNLLTKGLFGWFMPDYPARRVASVIEYALAITVLFGFLARRYGLWVGGVAAASLLLMPRVYGDGHIAGTDMPGMLLWGLTALAFWKGLNEENARRYRVAVGVLIGLGFVEKMATILVVLPLVGWLAVARLPKTFRLKAKYDWIDAVATLGLMLIPLVIAFAEILRLKGLLPPPAKIDLFRNKPLTSVPGAILLAPLLVWVGRRTLARLYPNHPIWGVERPGLEILAAILAFGSVISWLGNPAWWRETLPRLAHYYMLSTARRGALPDIRILYFGQIYEYSLPWANAFVLTAITVPAGILVAAMAGVVSGLRRLRYDPIPVFFLFNMLTLPFMRMTDFPAHDGVRLFLPTFFFLAAMSGWGSLALAESLAGFYRSRPIGSSLVGIWAPRVGITILVLAPAAMQLSSVHPFELSYYNELIDGPAGAWREGFELTYWYDALDEEALRGINFRMPPDAAVSYSTEWSAPSMVFADLQSLGKLRSDIGQKSPKADTLPHMWLLTHDSKATSFSRLLFGMTPKYPEYARQPQQLDGLRVMTVADPDAVSRAMALWLLCHGTEGQPRVSATSSPAWVRSFVPFLGRFWGDGLSRVPTPSINEEIFQLASENPKALRLAIDRITNRQAIYEPIDLRVKSFLDRDDCRPQRDLILNSRPQALRDAVDILIRRPADLKRVLTHAGYTDPGSVNGYLDSRPGAGEEIAPR